MPVIIIIRIVWRGSLGWSTMFTEQTHVHASLIQFLLSHLGLDPWSWYSGCLTATDKICCMEIHSIIAQNKEFNRLFLRQVAGIDSWELPLCHCTEHHVCISLTFGVV